MKFNPPPNWPPPPAGWVPTPGWQPDPAWGPAPQGWQLWQVAPDELLFTETLDRDVIGSILTGAYMTYELDSDGDILIKDQCKVFVLRDPDKHKLILMTQYGFKPGTSEMAMLECANKINRDYIIVKAAVVQDSLRFTYDVLLDGGLPARALPAIIKRFASIPPTACLDYGAGIIA